MVIELETGLLAFSGLRIELGNLRSDLENESSEGGGKSPTVEGYGNKEQGMKSPARLGNYGTFA